MEPWLWGELQAGTGKLKKNGVSWEFPCALIIRIWGFHSHDPGSIPS